MMQKGDKCPGCEYGYLTTLIEKLEVKYLKCDMCGMVINY